MTKTESKLCMCEGTMKRAYIRKMTGGISKWIPFGYYCPKCNDIVLDTPADSPADSPAKPIVEKIESIGETEKIESVSPLEGASS